MKQVIVSLCVIIGILLFTVGCSKDDDSANLNASPTRDLQQEDNNKQLVLKFYQRLFGDKDVSAIDDYIVADYIQHNPQVADGRDALKAMDSRRA